MRNDLLIALLACAAPAAADTLDVRSTTLLAGHADPRDGHLYTVVPLYETVSATASDLQNPLFDDFKLVLSAWGELAFGDPREGMLNGDVQLGYAEGKVGRRHVTFRLGRQMVIGGAARVTPLDGLSVTVDGWHGFGVTVYGGAPVTPRFGINRGDGAWGGRVFWRRSFSTEIGLSYIEVLGAGRVGRDDVAADARWNPVPQLALAGDFIYSLRELRIAQADAVATWTPARQLELSADYRRVAPDLFLPLNSVFAVFAQTTRDEAGGAFVVRPARRFDLRGDYHVVIDDEGIGHRGGLRGALRLGGDGGTTLGAEGRGLRLPSNGYWQARLFGTQRFPHDVLVTLDFDTYLLEKPLQGQTLSFTAAATAGWSFAPGWRVMGAAFLDETPFVERRTELMLKLVYDQTFVVVRK